MGGSRSDLQQESVRKFPVRPRNPQVLDSFLGGLGHVLTEASYRIKDELRLAKREGYAVIEDGDFVQVVAPQAKAS